MPRTRSILATALLPCGAVVAWGLLAPSSTSARQDGPDWEVASTAEGCASCHLSDDAPDLSSALTIEGLPQTFVAGQTYALTIVLTDPALENAGFLLTLRRDNSDLGSLAATDVNTEAMAGQARSSWEGSFTTLAHEARWSLVWTAPEAPGGSVSFDLWANAGNYDLSPLGDRLHHRELTVSAPETVQ